MSGDISRMLNNWPYESGKISVRKILGDDGRPKIQLRLDLGVLQMETQGRPDGQRPHGFESLLEYYQEQIRRYRAQNGDDAGFSLDSDACEELRAESLMYYHRYLSEFALEDYPAVRRDADRNLVVADLCSQYGASETDRMSLEQYRPYVLMMSARSEALDALEHEDFATARRAVTEGLEAIRAFLDKYGQPQLMEASGEAAVLEALLEEIESREPLDPVRALEKSLASAVEEERYEEAARIRDQLQHMRKNAHR